jgi:hypothetical protein
MATVVYYSMKNQTKTQRITDIIMRSTETELTDAEVREIGKIAVDTVLNFD